MYYSDLIVRESQADKILALQLDKSLAGVRGEVLDIAARIKDGAVRAIYYASCFTDNYQDVCTMLKSEGNRFLLGLVQLILHRRIVYDLIRIYYEEVFKNKTQQQILAIGRALEKLGVNVSASTLTVKSFVAGLTATICLSTGFSSLVVARVRKLSGMGVFLASSYGYVKIASESVGRLKLLSPAYYHALYMQDLEMMYFLVEPIFMKVGAFGNRYMSDDDLISTIWEMAK
ncbi:hypothetical protein TUM12370_33080 [Salmonella enterica subsp. enterica serovar Choleraesuis]|nr:hypothetical protein TUM12370_33080 [Salmonella enterica subsp. enterica serovar Choleraesuis]